MALGSVIIIEEMGVSKIEDESNYGCTGTHVYSTKRKILSVLVSIVTA